MGQQGDGASQAVTKQDVNELERRIKESLRPFVGKPNSYELRSDMVDAVVLVLAKWDIEHEEKDAGINRKLAASVLDKHFMRDC